MPVTSYQNQNEEVSNECYYLNCANEEVIDDSINAFNKKLNEAVKLPSRNKKSFHATQ